MEFGDAELDLSKEAFFDEDSRKEVFHKLLNLPIWMKKGDETREKSSARMTCGREEAFFGKILGAKRLPKGFKS